MASSRPRAPTGAFVVTQGPAFASTPSFRFAHRRVAGPYVPWTRVQTLDEVRSALEEADVTPTGPATGVYFDLPRSGRPESAWETDLGYPVAAGARVPIPLLVREVPTTPAVTLSYRGDLASFPQALAYLLAWSEERGVHPRGHLVERFHVSDPMTLVEERDVFVHLE